MFPIVKYKVRRKKDEILTGNHSYWKKFHAKLDKKTENTFCTSVSKFLTKHDMPLPPPLYHHTWGWGVKISVKSLLEGGGQKFLFWLGGYIVRGVNFGGGEVT